jgi:hypothetical protein
MDSDLRGGDREYGGFSRGSIRGGAIRDHAFAVKMMDPFCGRGGFLWFPPSGDMRASPRNCSGG